MVCASELTSVRHVHVATFLFLKDRQVLPPAVLRRLRPRLLLELPGQSASMGDQAWEYQA